MKSSFLIVADRGNLKAFRVEKVPADRPPRVALVQAFSLAEGHLKISDVNTDNSGQKPSGLSQAVNSGGRHQSSTAERHVELEGDRRSAKHLAELITNVLREQHPETWSFAAPAEINQAILNELDASLRKQVAENLPRDLVNTNPNELLNHFSAVRAA